MHRMSNKSHAGRCAAWTFGLAGLALMLVAGCSGASKPKTIKVQGKVMYKGQPVTQGDVSFLPVKPAQGYPSRPATGTLKPDGTYQLTSFEANDGAVPGEYQVSIVSKTGGPTPEEPDAQEEWHIPKKYGNPAESGLTATVSADASSPLELNFTLED